MAGTRLGVGMRCGSILLVMFWCGDSSGVMGQSAQPVLGTPGQEECPPLANGANWCQPMIKCSAFWSELIESPKATCSGQPQLDGYKSTTRRACCPPIFGVHNRMGLVREASENMGFSKVPPPDVGKLMSAEGRREIVRLSLVEKMLPEHAKPDVDGGIGLMVTRVTQKLKQVMHLSKEGAGIGTQVLSVKDTALSEACPVVPFCRLSKYRTMDGSCNNLKMPLLGRSNTALGRFLPANYKDGVYQMHGEPNVRLVRHGLARDDQDYVDGKTTAMVMQFGQFISHDLSSVPRYRKDDGGEIQCCTEEGQHLRSEMLNRHCIPLDIFPNDPFYSKHGVRCVNQVRSMVAPRSQCNFGYAEQLNSATHWLDGSQIYGSTQSRSDALRQWQGGRLRTTKIEDRHLLPLDHNNTKCIGFDKGLRCFLAGDGRANMVPTLTVLHTVFVREHNRQAAILSAMNQNWSDEQIFQETRRNIIALLQHITYNEFLPVLLGSKTMEDYGLLSLTSGYSYSYKEDVSSVVFNGFSTAAFRFGHSLVAHAMDLVSEDGTCYYRMNLRDWFKNSHSLIQRGVLDGLIRGMVNRNSMLVDRFFSTDLTNFVLKEQDKPYGLDLVSLNIQRSRDHGLPSYNDYRSLFGLAKVNSFGELNDSFSSETVSRMEEMYAHPDDIDLYVGGMAESVGPDGGLMGSTFKHMIAQQFARIKQADYHWYEAGGQINSFTPGQLQEIRKSSLASVLCLNGDDIHHMPTWTFLSISHMNPRLPCSDIPAVSLLQWKE